MVFVDTNVFMYAVGRAHPLRDPAREFFGHAVETEMALVTSAEVLQELLHAYVPVGRIETLDAALTLITARVRDIWPVEADDVRFARLCIEQHPGLSARDLLHVACCKRRRVRRVKTFDRGLAAVFDSP